MKLSALIFSLILLFATTTVLFSQTGKCLYVVETPDPVVSQVFDEIGLKTTISATIPADLSEYDLVFCREYSACTPATAPYIENFVKNGGGAILIGGTPSTFGGGGWSCRNISEWFGTAEYSNVGVSDALVSINNPLGTSLLANDVIEHSTGWGGAAVNNVAGDATILAQWDYGSDNIHSFIRSFQSGRVAFWAGNASYNAKTTELLKAICAWAANLQANQCLYLAKYFDPSMLSVLAELNYSVTQTAIIPSDFSAYDLLLVHDYEGSGSGLPGKLERYVENDGGVVLIGGAPSKICGGGYSSSCISEWFGTSQYSNVGVSYAKASFDNPLGTSLNKNDIIEESTGWGGAAVQNVTNDATILAEWDYGSGNIHSFIRPYQGGRVAFWAGYASYNAKSTELFKAVCAWTGQTSAAKFKCLYVVETADPVITNLLDELGFSTSTSTTIPSEMSEYDLVILREYSACNSTTAPYVGNYVQNGGCAILMGGTPSEFGGGGWSCTNIAEWFGSSDYTNVGLSDAKVSFNHPLGTSLLRNQVIEHCTSWGGAAMNNVAGDATILAEWDYGNGNIHSFIRSYQQGRVAFWAGNASYNSGTTELFKAICNWSIGGNTTEIEKYISEDQPAVFSLRQNYPNPFNATTVIPYTVNQSGQVKIVIYNNLGEKVKEVFNLQQLVGSHNVTWDGTNEKNQAVSSGMYFYSILMNGLRENRQMVLVK